jgi:type I restriction enzyme S subunit
MKKGWKTKTLEEACQFSNGLWKGEKPPFVNVGVIRNTNFTKEGTLDDSDIAYLDVEAKKLEKRRLQFGDIILEKSGGGPKQPVGRVALFDKDEGDFSFSNFTAALRVLEPDDLDFRFLHKFLHWTYVSGVTERMQSNSTGIRNLDGDAYKAIEITYPPLAEQQRIVDLLDEAFEGLATAKANAEKNLQNARALFESHLQSVFTQRGPGWVEHTLGDLIEIQNGYAFKSNDYTDAGYFVIRITNVQDGEITLANPRFIKLADKKLERFILNDGDILISLTGNIGRVGIIQEDQLPAVLNQRVARITIKDQDADRNFLFRFLLSRTFRESLQEAGHGAAQQNVSTKEIEAVRLSLPNKKEQRRIVEDFDNFAEETQRLARLYERKHGALEALKKSLLHQAFSGEL